VSQTPVCQLLSPSPTVTPTFEGQDQSTSPDSVEQQLLQESSSLLDSLHRTPGGWDDYDNDNDTEIFVPDRRQNNAPQRTDSNLSIYVCNGGNAAVLGVAWLLLLEAIPPRLAPVLLPL
jgi:hypothetical protein